MSNVPHHSVSWLPDSESHVEEEQNSSNHKSKSASLFITGLFVFEEDRGNEVQSTRRVKNPRKAEMFAAGKACKATF